MPLILIIFSPLVAAVFSFFVKKKTSFLEIATAAVSSLELIAAIVIAYEVYKSGSYTLSSYLAVDALGALLLMIVAVVGFAASIYSIGYLREEVKKGIIGFSRVKQYFILFHLFVMAMFFAIATTSPIMMWIAIEATTLSTAFLISFYNKPSAMEAAWKYLIINSVGLLLGFLGTLLFFTPLLDLGYHGLVNWSVIMKNVSHFDPFVIKMAFIFVFIGYGTKVGLAPMHTWRPDAYSKAPTPIVALFSGALLNVAFLALLRFKTVTDAAIGASFSSQLFIFFGILSIVIAAFIMYVQKNYKRLIAYSSIEHAGIMALGFGFGGIGAFAGLLHMIYHSITKSLLFLTAGNVFLKYSSTKIANVRGMISSLPLTSVIFIIGFLAITGIPPFGIFVSEFYILSAGIANHPIASIIALFSFALVFVGFLKHVVAMVFSKEEEEVAKGEAGIWTILPLIFLTIILIIFSIYLPTPVKTLMDAAILIY